MFQIHSVTPNASCALALEGDDADRVHAGIVTQATLTVVGADGAVYLKELSPTTGYHRDVTQADVDEVAATLAYHGEYVVFTVWGEWDWYGNAVGDRRR